jgi:hypothetical protein
MKLLAPLTVALAALVFIGSATASVTIGQVAPSYAATGCSNCAAFQYTTDSGNSYTVPTGGVITKFMMRSSTTAPTPLETAQFFVVRPISGANFSMVKNLDPLPFAGLPADTVEIFPVRVSVQPGDLIGNHWSTSTVNGFFAAGSANTFKTSATISSTPSGTTFTATDALFPGSATSRLNLQATIEPDADADGYGDETQDGCPKNPLVHSTCGKPLISVYKFSPNRFAIDKSGTALSPSASAKGTTIILTLSEAANVSFVIKLKAAGRKVGKSCKKQTLKNKKNKKCTRYPSSYKFARDLPAGTSNLAFSGRIKSGSKTKTLAPGKYAATAYPFSVQSQLGGDTPTTTFEVVAPAKKH